MTKRYFVTGTDIGAGKTVANCTLLQAAAADGWRTAGYKPVASGSDMIAGAIRNSDALALQRNSTLPLCYEQVNPYAFLEPTSPHIVSETHRTPLDFTVMSRGLRALEAEADWVLVEGAGGWLTPLSSHHTFADWVIQEQLPVILVVGISLGCINHALLTVQAGRNAGLPLAGWIDNNLTPPGKWYAEYLPTLKQRIDAPLSGEIPWLKNETDRLYPVGWLSLDALA